MTHELDQLSQPLVADRDVMSARTWQRVSHQHAQRVAVLKLVGGRRKQVAQLVKALPLDAQPDRLHDDAVSPVDVVVIHDAIEHAADDDRLGSRPRLARSGAEQQLVVRPLLEHATHGLGGLRPQRDDVSGAGLAAVTIDPSFLHVGLAQLGQLRRAEAAVEREQHHRLQLHPAIPVCAAASRTDALGDLRQDATQVGRLVQLPLHPRLRSCRELRDHARADTQRPTPSHLDGVVAGGSEVADRALREVGAVRGDETGVQILHGVGRHVIGQNVADDPVDSFGAEPVLLERSRPQLTAHGVATAVDDPAVENVVQRRRGRHVRVRLADRLSLRRQRRCFAMIDRQRLVGRALAADPTRSAGDARHVATLDNGEREASWKARRPLQTCSDRYAPPLGAGRSVPEMPEKSIVRDSARQDFPAHGASLFSSPSTQAQLSIGTATTAGAVPAYPSASRTAHNQHIPGNSGTERYAPVMRAGGAA